MAPVVSVIEGAEGLLGILQEQFAHQARIGRCGSMLFFTVAAPAGLATPPSVVIINHPCAPK